MAPSIWLHRYAQLTVAAAFFVIFAGAMVTSTGSGMAVPDWPQSFGSWMPKMEGGVFYEHGHRMVAAATGALVTGLALWAQFSGQSKLVRRLAWYAFLAICLQGLLGGTTVLLGTWFGWDHTSPYVSMMHASLAQALFALLVSIAVVSAPGWQSEKGIASGPKVLALATVGAAFVQIVIGAVMRHENAGLIIYDFPLSYGKLIPPFYEWRVALNFAHRVGALLVLALALSASITALKSKASAWVKSPALALLGAVLLQVTLGAFTVWTRLQVHVTSLHVIGASLVLASSLVLFLRLQRSSGA